ncbi:hypothetical protein V6N13_081212 [Hibiscus sabdariffa]
MVDVLEHSGSEVLTGFQSVQKKGRTCDAATITDGETMEVVEGVSSEKTGEFSGVTNRKRHASTVNHGFARGTKHNAANGGTDSRFNLLAADVEEIEPVVPVNLDIEKNVM